MANIFDYLRWRGDIPVSVAPWTLIDTLICATACYVEFGPKAVGAEGAALREIASALDPAPESLSQLRRNRRELLNDMAASKRFSAIRLRYFINRVDDETQFSAVIMDVPYGPRIVAFRGTDSTLTGWKEDCCMSYETVPAQLSALEYLRGAIDTADSRPIIAAGHSKGGNLAAYAAAHLDAKRQARLSAVASFDGPGLDDETMASAGYTGIRPILTSVIPQDSVIGLLMGFHQDFTIVYSTAAGIQQHDVFTWQLNGPALQELSRTTASSRYVNETLHEWLNKCSREERRAFVDTLFDLLASGNAVTLRDLTADKLKTLTSVIAANRDMDPEERRQFYRVLGLLATTGADNAVEIITHKTAGLLSGLKNLLPKTEETNHAE